MTVGLIAVGETGRKHDARTSAHKDSERERVTIWEVSARVIKDAIRMAAARMFEDRPYEGRAKVRLSSLEHP